MMKIKIKIMLSFSLFSSFDLFGAIVQRGQNSIVQIGENASLILSAPMNINGTLSILNTNSSSIQFTNSTDALIFSDGFLQDSTGGKTLISGTMDSFNGNRIILDSGQSLVTNGHMLFQAVEVKGSGNSIKGQPTFSSPILLEDQNALLNLGIESKLSQNIVMNGGTLLLTEDLALQDNIIFSGDGVVDMNNKTLSISSSTTTPWSGNLTFRNANDIWMTGNTILSGQWTFEGSGAISRINGNGCVLDISSGGEIVVGDNHTLLFVDVHLKGLGSGHGNLLFANSASHVKLSNVTISLDGNYSVSSGLITVEGNNCYLVVRNGYTFTVSNSAVLTVAGVIFFFDFLGLVTSSSCPIITASGGVIALLNYGEIRSSVSGGVVGVLDENLTFNLASGVGDNQLQKNCVLSAFSTITFSNSSIGTPKSLALDGQGYFIQFNYLSGQYMTLAENTTVTLKNILLKDFDFDLINFQGSGSTKAKLLFGENCAVSLSKDLTLGSMPIAAVGNVTILGNGTTLNVSASDMVTIDNASKVLTMKDLNINLGNATGIRCLNDSSKLLLQNLNLHATSVGMDFQRGSLDVKDHVYIEGMNENIVGGVSIFSFSSKGILRVLSGSRLTFGRNLYFSYNPDVSGDVNAFTSKRHFILMDPSAVLFLDSCCVLSGVMGFALDYGQVFIDGKTVFQINPAFGAEVEFGSALQVEILPSGILDIDGALKYVQTSYS